MRHLRTILMLGLLGFLGYCGWRFAAANAVTVDLDLVWLRVPNLLVWQLAIGSVAFGAALVLLAWLVLGARSMLVKRRYRKTIRQLEAEVHQLRSLPLSEQEPPAGAVDPPVLAQGRG